MNPRAMPSNPSQLPAAQEVRVIRTHWRDNEVRLICLALILSVYGAAYLHSAKSGIRALNEATLPASFLFILIISAAAFTLRKNRQLIRDASTILNQPPIAVGRVRRQIAGVRTVPGILCISGAEICFLPFREDSDLLTLTLEDMQGISSGKKMVNVRLKDGRTESFRARAPLDWQEELEKLVGDSKRRVSS